MDNKEALNALTDIRSIMERATKFQSFSGIAAILVGIYAIVATSVTFLFFGEFRDGAPMLVVNTPHRFNVIIWVALTLLVISIATTAILSYKKAPKSFKLEAPIKRLLWSFGLPLFIGGVLCYSMILQGRTGMTSTMMLVFYGLSLVGAATHTYSSVKYLGYGMILLGLIDSFVPGYALLFWTLGFGVLHIAYGIVFYFKHDKAR